MGVILTLPDGASPVDPGPSQLDIYAAMVIGHRARDLSDEQALERAKQDVHTAIPYVLEVWPESGGGRAGGYTWSQQE